MKAKSGDAAKLKEDMKDLVQGEIIVVDHPEKAAKADAVITVTPATQAFLKGEWLEKGTVYFAMGSYQECDDEAILGADKLICDHVGQCLHRGNLKALAEQGKITADSVYCTVGELDSRLIVEDVPMGLLPISALGKAAGVPTPIIDSVITLAGALVKQDFWQTGRTLKSLNIAGLTREELLARL